MQTPAYETTSNPAPGKGQRAYELRKTTGRTWEKIAAEVDSASPEAAVAGAKKYARSQTLQWPIKTVKHTAKEKALVDEDRAQAKRDARIYKRVGDGTAIKDIKGLTPTNVYRALDRHCERTGASPLARNPERSYRLRESGQGWGEVADSLGYKRENAAIEAARGFAQDNSLVWPPPIPKKKKDPSEYVGVGFYDAALQGQEWGEIAQSIDRLPSYVKSRAKVYAKAHDLPWPPELS